MARKLRIEYEGALYHVINRGNYRGDVFGSVGAAEAFTAALAETCEQFGWRLHAYVIMRNHYHLALETPQPNLVSGMHWLQSTYSTRFNRFRSENGHLFQGRYQSLLVEDRAALVRVVNYIHLNPVRAGIVSAENIPGFRWSSLPRFLRGGCPVWLSPEQWLEHLGFDESPAGWQAYGNYLRKLSANPAEQDRQEFKNLSHGWAIGTQGWRQAMAKEYAHRALSPGIERAQLHELREARWTAGLALVLQDFRKTAHDAKQEPKAVDWKVAAARRLRKESGAPYAWIAEELHMGMPSSIRVYLSRQLKINK